jgi:hypothetical protein
VRSRIRFQAVFRPCADAAQRLQRAAPGLPVQLQPAEGWSAFAVDLDGERIGVKGWPSIEDQLVACCEEVDAVLGRSHGPDGFPRLEPWELTGAVDAIDAFQWFGPALTQRLSVATRRLDGVVRSTARGGTWLRVVEDPLADPSAPAKKAARLLYLTTRPLPAAAVAAIEAVRAAEGARAVGQPGEPMALLNVARRLMGQKAGDAVERLLVAAYGAGVRDRVARHLAACVERYGAEAAAAAVPLVTFAPPALLARRPEDVVETAVRIIAWHDPARPAVETAIAVERFLESSDEGADGVLTMVLESRDRDSVRGMIRLDLMSVQMCDCEKCADRKQRIATARQA